MGISSADPEAYGDYYQWGRGTDGHEKVDSITTATNSTTDTPGHGQFITEGDPPWDWRTPQNDNLWQGESGTNNPCPTGFRLPTKTEFDTERTSWQSKDAAGAFASPTKLVVAGGRFFTDGELFNAGVTGYYHSSTIDDRNCRYLGFPSDNAGVFTAYVHSGYRGSGRSVRCIQD